VLGDTGFIGSLELHTPTFSSDAASLWNRTYALAFVEGAALKVLEPQPDQTTRFNISSSGLGLRSKFANGLNFNLDLGLPFRTSTYTRANDLKLHAKLNYEF
jgi:hemolysin activation/secretion protein